MLDELADLAATLSDHTDDGNIRRGAARDICEKRRLSGPRLAKYADTLSPPAGEEAIESPDAERKRAIDARASEGFGRRGADIAIGPGIPRRPGFAIDAFSEGVQNAPEQPPAHTDTKTLPRRHNFGGARKPCQIAKGGEHREPVSETDDLSLHPNVAAGLHKLANLSDPYILDGRFDADALKVSDAAFRDPRSAFIDSV
jgi:hypothetical protein